VIQLGSGIGICPVAVGAVFVKTIAAILVATVCAEIKMRFAEILFTRRT
jgi:hypothetical protein